MGAFACGASSGFSIFEVGSSPVGLSFSFFLIYIYIYIYIYFSYLFFSPYLGVFLDFSSSSSSSFFFSLAGCIRNR